MAGFHFLISYINVFNKPHPPSLSSYGGTGKGFSPRRTCEYAAPIKRDRHAETRGERSPGEKEPFLDGN